MIPRPLVRRVQASALALAVTLAVLAWTQLRGPGGDAALPAERPANPIPFADVCPYGANFFLEREPDPWTRRHSVEMAARAGLRWAKQHFLWSEIEAERGVYSWAKYDQLVDLYREHGLEVVARLDWAPPWVRADYVLGINNLPEDLDDYARYVGAVAEHFRGRVRFYQIWNEPNLLAEWGNRLDRPVDPAAYVAMLRAASQAARQADPDAVIIAAPLAINLETLAVAGNMSDLDYLEGMYRAGAAPYFDILGANAFGMDLPPADPPAVHRLNFRRVELQRAIMERHRDGNKAVWLNEYGWNASPEEMPPELQIWQRVSEEEQAAWTVEGYRWAAEHWPWAGVINIWYFRQWGGKAPTEADYYFRMVDTDFTPRRLYDAVAAEAGKPIVAGPGAWAERSSPVRVERLADWRWARVPGALDGNALVAVAPGAGLRLRFHGSSVSLRALQHNKAGKVRLQVTGGPGNGAPREVDLQSVDTTWQWLEMPAGAADVEHELLVQVMGSGEVAIDGFRVELAQVGLRASPLPARLLACVAALLSAALAIDARRVVDAMRSGTAYGDGLT